MDQKHTLNALDTESSRRLAKTQRLAFGFTGENPIANDIFTIPFSPSSYELLTVPGRISTDTTAVVIP